MPSAGDTEQLAIEVLARIGDLEKNMKRANAITAKAFTDMRTASKSATRQMEADMTRSTQRISEAAAITSTRIGAMGKAFAGNLVASAVAAGLALVSLGAIISKTKDALEEFGNINDKSAQAGLDPEVFQELGYQASLAGVGMDELSGALNTFSKNAGLAVVGKGRMVTALQKLNPALLESIRNAQSQEQRFRMAVDAINAAATASEKAALSTAMFGDAGGKLVVAFDGGSAAIDRTAASARQMGLIVDRELIARADELGDKFDTASKVMDLQFKQTMIDLAPVMISTMQIAGDVARAIAAIVDSMQALDNQSTKGLQTGQAANAMQRLDIENRILDLKRQEGDGSISMMDRAELADLQAKNDLLKEQDTQMTKILATRRETAAAASGKSVNGGSNMPLLAPLPVAGATSTRNDAAKEALRQAEAVKELIADLQNERMQVGMTDVQVAASNALRKAGAAATAEQRQEIVSLIEQTAREKAANDQLKQTLDDLKSTTTSFVTTFRQGMMSGQTAAEAFKNALLNVLDTIMTKIETMAVDKAFAGLFGGLGGTSFVPTTTLGGFLGVGGAPAAAKSALPSGSAGGGLAGRQHMHVSVGVSADGNGNIRPFVESVAIGKAEEAVANRVPGMVRKGVEINNRHVLPGKVRGILNRPRDTKA